LTKWRSEVGNSPARPGKASAGETMLSLLLRKLNKNTMAISPASKRAGAEANSG